MAASRDDDDGMNIAGDDRAAMGTAATLSDLRQEVTDVLMWKMTAVAGLPSKSFMNCEVPTQNEQIKTEIYLFNNDFLEILTCLCLWMEKCLATFYLFLYKPAQ